MLSPAAAHVLTLKTQRLRRVSTQEVALGSINSAKVWEISTYPTLSVSSESFYLMFANKYVLILLSICVKASFIFRKFLLK